MARGVLSLSIVSRGKIGKSDRYAGEALIHAPVLRFCAKFVAHRLERFQVKGYATPLNRNIAMLLFMPK